MKKTLLALLLSALPACNTCASAKPPSPETPPANLKEQGFIIDSPAEGAAVTGRWVTVSGWFDPASVAFVAVSGAPVSEFYLPTGHVGIPTVHVIQRPNGRFIAPRVPVLNGETALTVLAFAKGGAVFQPLTRKVTATAVEQSPVTVVADPPQATPGKSVKFRASTGDEEEHAWQWDFNGDGVFDDESVAPSHTFTSTGRFAVVARTKVGDGYVYGMTPFTVGKEPKVLKSTSEVVRPSRLACFTKEYKQTAKGLIAPSPPEVLAALDGDAVRLFDGDFKPLHIISGLASPKAIDFDEEGRLYVLEAGADKVSRYLPNGTLDVSFGEGGSIGPPRAGTFAQGHLLVAGSDYASVVAVDLSKQRVGWLGLGAEEDPGMTLKDAGVAEYSRKRDGETFDANAPCGKSSGTWTSGMVVDGSICYHTGTSSELYSRPGVRFLDAQRTRGIAGDFWALDDAGALHLYRNAGSSYVGKWNLEYQVTSMCIGDDDRVYVAGQGKLELRDLPRLRPYPTDYREDGP